MDHSKMRQPTQDLLEEAITGTPGWAGGLLSSLESLICRLPVLLRTVYRHNWEYRSCTDLSMFSIINNAPPLTLPLPSDSQLPRSLAWREFSWAESYLHLWGFVLLCIILSLVVVIGSGFAVWFQFSFALLVVGFGVLFCFVETGLTM